jgi:hypothetical protein
MLNKLNSYWIGSVVVLATTWSAAAREPANGPEPLLQAIEQLKDRPVDPTVAVEEARERLLSSIQNLEKFLAGGGKPDAKSETLERWSQWLGLPALKQQLAGPAQDLNALRSIEERLYQNHTGLELPVFLNVRRDLRAYLVAQEYATSASPDQLFHQRVSELAQCISRLNVQPNESDAHQVGKLLVWLESLNDEGASLAQSARHNFCHTNAVAQASGRLANVLMERNVSERNYIAEVVLGSFTQGVAIVQGHVLFGTIPNQERGTLEIRLQGGVSCPSNVADRRRLSVYTSSYTTINATKQIFIDDQGLRLAPAAANCATSVEIRDIDARSRILERLSWRRANQMAPEAESLASRKAESEAASKLNREADASLGNINNIFCQKIRAPLIRFDALPEKMQFWTDARHLRISLSQHNELQLAAASAPPSLQDAYDLGGSVHESMINNLAESLLGGRTIQDETWLEIMHLITGTPPRALWVHDRAERWAATFSKERPLIARFENDRLGFTLRFSHLRKGAQEFRQTMEVEARFIPQITRDGPALARDGDMAVRLIEKEDDPNAVVLRGFLTRKFGAVFAPELHFYGVTPPAGGSLGKLRLLAPVEFRGAGGWLTLAYQLESGASESNNQDVLARR